MYLSADITLFVTIILPRQSAFLRRVYFLFGMLIRV